MRITVFENKPATDMGGQERSLFEICRGLSERGHEISLVYTQEGNLLGEYGRFCREIVKVDGYTIQKTSLLNSSFRFIQGAGRIKRMRSEVLYTNQYQDTLFASAASLFKHKTPLVCHLRLPPPPSLCFQWALGLKGVRRFAANSKHVKAQWMKKGVASEKIDVVYNGIDTSVYRPSDEAAPLRVKWGFESDDILITFAARLDPGKGLDLLIEAFADIKKRYKNAKLLIAGQKVWYLPLDGGARYVEQLKNKVHELGLDGEVRFLGHVFDIVALYQISDLTILPSLHDEAFGRILIESMACGTPVAASRVGGIPEVLTGEFEAFLFEPQNKSALVRHLERWMQGKRIDSSLGGKCRKYVSEKFGFESSLEGVERVLNKALSMRSG